ncbi:MAG: pyridoxamine kinase [Lawsonibacter sp.]|nr:pyridoxamine kinase [Lawsonibacter sp.]
MTDHSKNILIIGDMPGYGKMGLAGMLPILSNMGHSVYNLPTALVSNNFDYGTFSVLDTTDYMQKTIAVWRELGFQFNCITTGFLASAAQVDILRDFIASQRREDLLVVTDPIMGDEGKLYNGSTRQTVENMRRLIGEADVIVPNLTEAEFLTGLCEGGETLSQAESRQVLDGLRACGAKSVVVTSGRETETGRHVVWGYDHRRKETFTIPYRFIKAHFPGTGDIFASILTGELLKGRPLQASTKRAMDVIEQLIFLEQDVVERNNGIRIERFLSVLRE